MVVIGFWPAIHARTIKILRTDGITLIGATMEITLLPQVRDHTVGNSNWVNKEMGLQCMLSDERRLRQQIDRIYCRIMSRVESNNILNILTRSNAHISKQGD